MFPISRCERVLQFHIRSLTLMLTVSKYFRFSSAASFACQLFTLFRNREAVSRFKNGFNFYELTLQLKYRFFIKGL